MPDVFDDAALAHWLNINGGGGPNGAALEVLEAVIEPGDVVVVPRGAPHAVLQVIYSYSNSQTGFGKRVHVYRGKGGQSPLLSPAPSRGSPLLYLLLSKLETSMAVAMNVVGASNVVRAARLALAAPDYHPTHRARLLKPVGSAANNAATVNVDAGDPEGSNGESRESSEAREVMASFVAVPASQARWFELQRLAVPDRATQRLTAIASIDTPSLRTVYTAGLALT
jgi:hypothetical protein